MVTEQPQENGKRVSNELILYRLGQIEIKFDRAIAKLEESAQDRVTLRLCTTQNKDAITSLKEDVDSLKNRSNIWDGINVVLIAIGTFLGISK